MKIIHVPDYETLSRKTAQLIAAQVLCKPDSLLGLATGSSPVGAYRYLAQWHISGDLDFSRACSVNLDEYCGLGADHVQSYHFFMRQNLFDAVNFRASWLPDGCAESLPDECRRYEAIIAERGPIDLQLLGIGHNGHIGFNEPAEQFVPQTHLAQLSQGTIQANARFFDSVDQVPLMSGVNFSSEITDIDIDHICSTFVIKVPDMIFNFFPGKNQSLIVHKVFQQCIFF